MLEAIPIVLELMERSDRRWGAGDGFNENYPDDPQRCAKHPPPIVLWPEVAPAALPKRVETSVAGSESRGQRCCVTAASAGPFRRLSGQTGRQK